MTDKRNESADFDICLVVEGCPAGFCPQDGEDGEEMFAEEELGNLGRVEVQTAEGFWGRQIPAGCMAVRGSSQLVCSTVSGMSVALKSPTRAASQCHVIARRSLGLQY